MNYTISVVIPTYNREKTILRSINSVLSQTIEPLEIIIVDDGSTDSTIKKVKDLQCEKISIIKNPINRGACYSRNVGVKAAKGEYIAFQDSDDVWENNKLEVSLSELKKHDVDLVFSQYLLDDKYTIPKSTFNSAEDKFGLLLVHPCVSTQTIVSRREVFLKIPFDVDMPRYQDHEVMLRIVKEYKSYFIEQPLVRVYTQKDSLSKNPRKGYDALIIILNKNISYINSHPAIAADYYYKIGTYAERSGIKGAEYFKKSYEARYNISVFLKYLASLIGLYKLLIKLKDKFNGRLR